jgi:hypothetical protein
VVTTFREEDNDANLRRRRARQQAFDLDRVGVVEPAGAGMASGINSKLRQVGIATGVATLGTILVSHVHSSVLADLRGTPLAGHTRAIPHAVSTGGGFVTLDEEEELELAVAA